MNLVVRGGAISSIAGDRLPVVNVDPTLIGEPDPAALRSPTSAIGKSRKDSAIMKAPKTLEGSITLNYSVPYELILGDVSADGRSVECVVRFPGFNPVNTDYEVVE